MRSLTMAVPVSFVLAATAQAQSTAFTYQGLVEQSGSPANGTYDIRFRLFDSAAGGAQVGATVCSDNVQVSDGVFTTTLDFGQQFGSIAARHLEISVRQDTGLSCDNPTGYTVLAPRQALSPTPRATAASVANALSAPDGTPAHAVFVDNTGKVGVGTTTPTHWMHIAAIGPTIALQDTSAASQQAGYVSYRDNTNTERAWVGYGTPGSPHFSIINARPGGKIELRTLGGGGSVVLPTDYIGIGTSSPGTPVHIASDLNAALLLQDIGPDSTQSGYVSFRNGSGIETAWMGYGTPGSPHMSMVNARSGGNIVLDPGPGAAVQVPVLEITGADLAEKFPATEFLEPGTVVAIDREAPGKLCMSRGAYNHCVAGVVSGAHNFSVGAVLGNRPGDEDAPVIALSGRVYVRCDATSGGIEPGDLLTTSNIPGHAMKAVDRELAHGAVIGKAMEPLGAGERGLILVLINLQ